MQHFESQSLLLASNHVYFLQQMRWDHPLGFKNCQKPLLNNGNYCLGLRSFSYLGSIDTGLIYHLLAWPQEGHSFGTEDLEIALVTQDFDLGFIKVSCNLSSPTLTRFKLTEQNQALLLHLGHCSPLPITVIIFGNTLTQDPFYEVIPLQDYHAIWKCQPFEYVQRAKFPVLRNTVCCHNSCKRSSRFYSTPFLQMTCCHTF